MTNGDLTRLAILLRRFRRDHMESNDSKALASTIAAVERQIRNEETP